MDYLDGKHTVFGEISEGFDVLEKINDSICDDNDRPYQDIRYEEYLRLFSCHKTCHNELQDHLSNKITQSLDFEMIGFNFLID